MNSALFESRGPEGYDTASTQVDLPLAGALSGWAARYLSEDMLAEDGIESQPHVTILYGLVSPDTSKVLDIGRSLNAPLKLSLGKLDYFDAPTHDVLYVTVESEHLHTLHRKLKKLPNVNRFPVYKPHMTIAYLKKGMAGQFVGDSFFELDFVEPGFWLNLAKNAGRFYIPTTGTFQRMPFNEQLDATLGALTESVGRRRPKRQMRLLYLQRKPQGVPKPRGKEEEAIDELIADVYQSFDWSAIYSGDKLQARIAANDLYSDLMNLAKLKIDDEAGKEDGLRFTLGDVAERWSVLLRFARRSSELAMRSIRRRVRV